VSHCSNANAALYFNRDIKSVGPTTSTTSTSSTGRTRTKTRLALVLVEQWGFRNGVGDTSTWWKMLLTSVCPGATKKTG
jgi:hypothetical protein